MLIPQQMMIVFALAVGMLCFQSQIFAQVESELEQELGSVRPIVDELLSKYEDQLNAVLKTRYESEKKFVEEVVDLVGQKKLPKKLVDSAWIWVRTNRPYTKYPFVYFERILRLQAAKLELEIPDFDRQRYYTWCREAAARAQRRR